MYKVVNLSVVGAEEDRRTEGYRHAIIARVDQDGNVLRTDGLRDVYKNEIMLALDILWPNIIEYSKNLKPDDSQVDLVFEAGVFRFAISSIIQDGDYQYYRGGQIFE